MKIFGILLIIVSVIICFVAFNMDVTVNTQLLGRLNNIGLLNDRSSLLGISGVLFISGSIFTAVSAIKDDELYDLRNNQILHMELMKKSADGQAKLLSEIIFILDGNKKAAQE